MGFKGYYKQAQDVFHNTVYIHLHAENIGKLYGTHNQTAAALLKSRNSIDSKQLYKQMFFNQLSPRAKESLIGLDWDRDDVFDAMEKGLQESVLNSVNTAALKQLHDIAGNMKDPLKSLQKSGSTNKIAKMDKLLEGLSQMVTLIEQNSNSPELALGLLADELKVGAKGTTTKKQASKKIMTALNKWKKASNGSSLKGIDIQRVNAMVNQLENLANNLKESRNQEGQLLNKEGWNSVFSNLFSLGFSEGLAFRVQQHAKAAAQEEMQKITLTGANTHKPIYTPAEGSFYTKKAITGKTDIKKNNIYFSAAESGLIGDFSQLDITVGLSMKFLTSVDFQPLKKNASLNISSGSGGSLGDAINEIYGPHKYYPYNVLAHADERPEELKILHDAILSREILRLFATTGGSSDFSQYIYANGEIISIWEIVKYVMDNDVGLSASQDTKNTQAVNLSIEGRPKIAEANKASYSGSQIVQAFKRSKAVNRAINSAKIKATLHAHKLANFIK